LAKKKSNCNLKHFPEHSKLTLVHQVKQDSKSFKVPITSHSRHPIVTPVFPYHLTYTISPLQKRVRIQSNTDNKNDTSQPIDQVFSEYHSNTASDDTKSKIQVSSDFISNESLVDKPEDDDEYSESKHFTVTFYKMLQSVSKEKPSFMNWTLDGSRFYIDYSQDYSEMSESIKPFFKRKMLKVDNIGYCRQTLTLNLFLC
jgi:hypothetical protein